MSDASFDLVVQTSKRWMQAWMDQDRAKLEDMLTDDYSLIIASAPGERFERPQWLEIAVGPYRCTRFSYEDVQVREVAPDVLAMSAIADFDATMNGVERSGRFFVTDLWRREDGRWKVCARFSSPLQDDAASIREMVASN